MKLPLSLVLVAALCNLLSAAEPTGITHSFLALGGKTYIRTCTPDDPAGKITWEYPAPTRDGFVLPNGNLLLAVSKGKTYPGGAAVEITRDHKILWEYKGTQNEVHSIQKTPEGTYVLTEGGPKPRLLEIDAAGKIVVEFPLQCQNTNAHMETRMTRKLPDGTYLCPHLIDFAIKQYDSTGKVLKVIDTKTLEGGKELDSWPFTVITLPSGNLLVTLTHSNRVAEFDPAGKRIWEITNSDFPDYPNLLQDPCGAQRLPNGNTVITSYASKPGQIRLLEVTPDKKIVWIHRNDDKPGIHELQILDTNGVPLAGPPLK